MVYQHGDLFKTFTYHFSLSIRKLMLYDSVCMLLLNSLAWVYDDQLLTAHHSGLSSGVPLDRSKNVSPCVQYMAMVSCCKT